MDLGPQDFQFRGCSQPYASAKRNIENVATRLAVIAEDDTCTWHSAIVYHPRGRDLPVPISGVVRAIKPKGLLPNCHCYPAHTQSP